MDDQKGTELFLAPELLGSFKTYAGKPADIWALGILMYAMIIGKYPFDGATREQIKETIIGKDISFTREKRILLYRKT